MHCVRNRSYLPLAVARQQAFAEILELSHLLMLEAVSACVTRRRSGSRAIPGRQLVGSFFELDRLFREPLFKGLRVSNTLALLIHLDG